MKSGNYSLGASGPVRIKIGIDVSIDRSYNREGQNHFELSKLIDSINSDTSDCMQYTTKATTKTQIQNKGDI